MDIASYFFAKKIRADVVIRPYNIIFIYQSTTKSPYNSMIQPANAMDGPKGICGLPRPIQRSAKHSPNTQDSIIASNASGIPRYNPKTANSLISPPPIVSFCKSRSIISVKTKIPPPKAIAHNIVPSTPDTPPYAVNAKGIHPSHTSMAIHSALSGIM